MVSQNQPDLFQAKYGSKPECGQGAAGSAAHANLVIKSAGFAQSARARRRAADRAVGSVRNQPARGCHRTFAWPLGDWLVVLAGLGLIGFAVQQIYAAIRATMGSSRVN